jgi:hypothetical protein
MSRKLVDFYLLDLYYLEHKVHCVATRPPNNINLADIKEKSTPIGSTPNKITLSFTCRALNSIGIEF